MPRHIREDRFGNIDAPELLGERYNAEPHRLQRMNPAGAASLIFNLEPDDLRRPAADVDHDDGLRIPVSQVAHPRGRQMRFHLAIDDLKFDAELVADARDEVWTVRSGSTGFGRYGPGPGDSAGSHLVAADAQRLHRTSDRGLAQPPGRGQPLAQTNDAREGVNNPEAVAGRASD